MFNVCNHPSTFIFGFSALLPERVIAGSAYEKAAAASRGVAGFERSNAAMPQSLAWGNLAGAVPVIGGIPVGLVRIFLGIVRLNHSTSQGSALIGRGIAEIVGMGPLLFLIDVFFTLGRLLPRAPVGDPA